MGSYDLKYPQDARHVRDALVHSLEYDAAFAMLANRLSRLPENLELPNPTTVFRFGQGAEDTVRRELEGLCSRLATLSMISRFDKANNALLLQRRFVEYLISRRLKRIGGREYMEVRNKVNQELRRNSPVQIITGFVVSKPSRELRDRSLWLADIYRVRNCLAHREGIVQMEDTKGEDVLRVRWLSTKATIDGERLLQVPYKVEGHGNLSLFFDESFRIWKIAQAIHLNAADCQDMALSLSLLEGLVLHEFELEMDRLISNSGFELAS